MSPGLIKCAGMKVVDSVFFFQEKKNESTEKAQVPPEAETRVRGAAAESGEGPFYDRPCPGNPAPGRGCGILDDSDRTVRSRREGDSLDLSKIRVKRSDLEGRRQVR
jgi:hypothetical protein